MQALFSDIKKSYQILHAFLTAVLLAYLLDPKIFPIFFTFTQTDGDSSFGFFQKLSLLLLVPVNIIFYSGIYGVFLEIISGETFLFTWEKFWNSVKKFWKIYLLISLLPYGAHFILTVLQPQRIISLDFIKVQTQILLIYVLVNTLFRRKYLPSDARPYKKIPLTLSSGLIILLFFLLNLAIFFFSSAVLTLETMSYLQNAGVLLTKYFHFFAFIYFTNLFLQQYPEIQKNFNNQKELFIIFPSSGGVITGIVSILDRRHPAVFVVLKALTPKNYKIRGFNRALWRKRYYQPNKLVAITCYSSNCAEAYKIAKEFKKQGSTVIMGGSHVTYLPREALNYCDSVVIGEAESVWPIVVEDYENNNLKNQYVGAALAECHQLVHQELLNSPPHVIKDFLETTRGCKFRCHFCTIPSLSGGKVRKQPVLDIIQLIKKINHKYKYISFLDNNIYNDPAYAKELFTALKPLNVKWQTFCTLDLVKNEKLLKLAKESGCFLLIFGYEIFGGSSEQKQGGKFAMAQKYLEYTKIVKKSGINVRANFIFGFDSDTAASLIDYWKFCFTLNPFITTLSLLTPLPGTHVYDMMLKENRLVNMNWQHYACHNIVFKHPHLNHIMMSRFFFPLIPTFFLLTTSKIGYILVVVIILTCINHIILSRIFLP